MEKFWSANHFPSFPYMIVTGIPSMEDQLFISVTVINKGDRPTTITNLRGKYYCNFYDRLFDKAKNRFIVNQPLQTQPIPYLLNPGATWQGWANQTPDLEAQMDEGYLFFEIFLSHLKEPTSKRIRVSKSLKNKIHEKSTKP